VFNRILGFILYGFDPWGRIYAPSNNENVWNMFELFISFFCSFQLCFILFSNFQSMKSLKCQIIENNFPDLTFRNARANNDMSTHFQI
jgi:hypothetical protein